MDWQQLTALLIVGVTVGLFAWNRIRPARTRFGKSPGACGCGDSESTATGSKPSIIYRQRKGERPEIVIKMR